MLKLLPILLFPKFSFQKKNLRSILYNLIYNAIKFAKEDTTPEIFIKTEEAGEFTLLSVKDNGIGIEPEKKEENIFKIHPLETTI